MALFFWAIGQNASGQNGVAPMAQCFLSMMHLMLAQAATREFLMKGEGSVRFTSSLDQLTKQDALIRRSIVLNVPLQLEFPVATISSCREYFLKGKA
jgi:hypothetical protein